MANRAGAKRCADALLDDDDRFNVAASSTPSKRKRVSKPATRKHASKRVYSKSNPVSLSSQAEAEDDLPQTPRTSTAARRRRAKPSTMSSTSATPEKRLRKHRTKPPATFLTKLQRARTQRMIVHSRTRTSDMSEEITIVGSTGNIYTVTITHIPTCNCPDSRKGNECKHKVYALHTVLRAPEHLVYQLALLSDELKEIFDGSPPIPSAEAINADGEQDSKRKPFAGTECPICYMDMLPTEDLVWCKAACGNNMHKSCFDQWVASQRGQTVKCVYCRTPWAQDLSKAGLAGIQAQGRVGASGYVNVASRFGMSGERDCSGYHQPWVWRRQRYYDFDDPYGYDEENGF